MHGSTVEREPDEVIGDGQPGWASAVGPLDELARRASFLGYRSGYIGFRSSNEPNQCEKHFH